MKNIITILMVCLINSVFGQEIPPQQPKTYVEGSRTLNSVCVIMIDRLSQPYTTVVLDTNILVNTNDTNIVRIMKNTWKLQSTSEKNGLYIFTFPKTSEARIITNLGSFEYHTHKVTRY